MGPIFLPSLSFFFFPSCLLTSSNFCQLSLLPFFEPFVFYSIFPSFYLEFFLTYFPPPSQLLPHLTTFFFPHPFFSTTLSLKTHFTPLTLTPATTQHPSNCFGSVLLRCSQPLSNLIRPKKREERGFKMSQVHPLQTALPPTPPKHTHLGEMSQAAYKHL